MVTGPYSPSWTEKCRWLHSSTDLGKVAKSRAANVGTFQALASGTHTPVRRCHQSANMRR